MKSYFNRFDRLAKLVMEDINSSKVSRRHHIVSEGKCSELRKLHCITVGQAKAQLAELDPNTELHVHSIDEKGETWDDCVVMGFEDWSDDYAVIDRDLFDRKAMTAGELLNNLQNIPDNRFFASLAYATYAHKPDYVKEIQRDGTIIVDMAWFPYNGEEGAPCRLDLQSVKVDKSKKVIKEHRAHRSSRRRVIKESISIQEEMDAIRVAADIIKRAMTVNKDEVLKELERDVNYDSSCCAFEDYNITRETWENSIKYGWMAETLPYFIDWQDYLFEGIEITPEERAILEKANDDAYVFSDEFEKGNLEGLDFCKEICSQFPVTIDPKELMIQFADEDDDMDYESVKKPVSKRRVIKEHRARRPSERKQVIKESAKRPVRRHIRRQIKK